MSVPELLRQVGICRALVVDDAFDDAPIPEDLVIESEEWTELFDDLHIEDKAKLATLYEPYKTLRADALRSDQAFVSLLWKNKDALASPAVRELFNRYDAEKATDRRLLAPLLAYLTGVGLDCATSGRNFQASATGVQLIFVDLFLSAAQREDDMDLSVEGVARVAASRKSEPPLVVLMSRSNALLDKRKDFRDRAQLFESNFRILSKGDIADPVRLDGTIRRLATHYEESRKLASFVHAWDVGLTGARDRTTKLIRKLRLADLAQIYELLLSAEGEPTGSYLVDIFDMVLQHEIERDESIIDAAVALNSLKGDSYPPPYVPGAPDLQDLIHRSLFQNRARLKLPGALASGVAFGDLLRPIGTPNPHALTLVDELSQDAVLTVLTPACDLQRGGAKRVLLLCGILRPLSREAWTYGDEWVKTPVVEMPDGSRAWIKWDLKHVLAWSQDEISTLLAQARLQTVARIRESHALELQQRLLSNLGRVGLAAQIPATFEFQVEAFYPAADNSLKRLHVPALEDGGVCFVGRAKTNSKMEERLILTESACDALIAALGSIEVSGVSQSSQPLFNELRGSALLLQSLERGVLLNSSKPQDWEPIVAEGGKVVGYVRRSLIADGDRSLERDRQRLTKAGVLLTVFERPHLEADVAGNAAAAPAQDKTGVTETPPTS